MSFSLLVYVSGACRVTEFQTRFQTLKSLEAMDALTYSLIKQY